MILDKSIRVFVICHAGKSTKVRARFNSAVAKRGRWPRLRQQLRFATV